MNSYIDYVKGKRVAVVGPAPSIVGSGQHDLIESYDVVCRLNAAIPVPEALYPDIGERTDVLYSTTKIPKCMNPDRALVYRTVKWVVCPYALTPPFDRYMRDFREWNEALIPFCNPYLPAQYADIETEVGMRPSIGLSAIIHLLSLPVAEIYVTGLTFYKKTTGNEGGYYAEYRKPDKNVQNEAEAMAFVERIGVHDPDKEHAWFKQAAAQDDRLCYDKAIKELIK